MKIHRSRPSLNVIGPFRIVQTVRYAMHLSTCRYSEVQQKNDIDVSMLNLFKYKTSLIKQSLEFPNTRIYIPMPTLSHL